MNSLTAVLVTFIKQKARQLSGIYAAAIMASPCFASIDEQRYHYELAKSALNKNATASFQQHYDKLGDYPLRLYLDFTVARKQLHPLNQDAVEAFIEQNKGSYLADNLHRQYLYTLSSGQHNADFLHWYRDSFANTELRCKYWGARIANEDYSAFDELAEQWIKPTSLPKACDSVIKTWMASEHWRVDYAWQRFLASMESGQRGLARYCSSLLPDDYQGYVKLVQDLDARPLLIQKHKLYRKPTLDMQEVIGFGIRKYAKRHPSEALLHWERYEASRIFDETISTHTKLVLTDSLLSKNKYTDVYRLLESSPSIRNTDTIERLIRRYLREQRWSDVLAGISLLPPESQQSDRWRYWSARAAALLSPTGIDQAHVTYSALAASRSFYGFLSADFVGKDYQLQDANTQLEDSDIDKLAELPAIRRVKELWVTGKTRESYAEWYHTLNALDANERVGAGILANRWGWHDKAIQAMIVGNQWDELGIRFPLAYKEHVYEAADKTQLQPALIFAIARQESAMSVNAKSPVGARGLMQLMPQTAIETARHYDIPHQAEDLLNPEHNLKLGSLYLDTLMEQYDGNRILATAAYNAGPNRVKRWREDSTLPFDVWIETIPFKETRGYVQNVLTFSVIYSIRMGEPEKMISQNEANSLL